MRSSREELSASGESENWSYQLARTACAPFLGKRKPQTTAMLQAGPQPKGGRGKRWANMCDGEHIWAGQPSPCRYPEM